MVLKNWKKGKIDRKDIDPKIKSVIAFGKNDGSFIHIFSYYYKPGYDFRTFYISQHKHFKTKKQALAYAKAYMRKH